MMTVIQRAKTYIVGVAIWASVFLFGILRAFADNATVNTRQTFPALASLWLVGLVILAAAMLLMRRRAYCRVKSRNSRDKRGW